MWLGGTSATSMASAQGFVETIPPPPGSAGWVLPASSWACWVIVGFIGSLLQAFAAIGGAAERAIGGDGLVAFVEQVIDPAIDGEMLADRHFRAHAGQHIPVEPHGVPRIVEAVADMADRAAERQAERQLVVERDIDRLARRASEVLAEIGPHGAVLGVYVAVVGGEGQRVARAQGEFGLAALGTGAGDIVIGAERAV